MSWFVKNILLLHLFVLVAAFGWMHGGARADLLLPVIPWLTFFVLEWLLVFPQAKSTETLFEARARVWRALKRDPLTYVALALTVVLVIPLFNVAKPPFYDMARHLWHNPKPSVTWLPYCVSPSEHSVLLLWFPPVLTAALAARHGLLKKSKRLLLEGVCWNSAAMAVIGFLQIYTGTDKLLWLTPLSSYFFSTFGYPNFAGAFFTLTATLSLGLWFQGVTEKTRLSLSSPSAAQDERSWFYANRMVLPAILAFLGAIASLSRAAILLSGLTLSVMIFYMLFYVWKEVNAGVRVMIFASLFAVCVIIASSFAVFKFESLKTEVRTITFSAIVERVTGGGLYYARVAKAIFRDHPVFGVGGWGYAHYQLQYLTPEELKNMQDVGAANVHNDSLQFLVEQGAVGYALILICVSLLVVPAVWQAWLVFRARLPSELESDAPKGRVGWLQRFPVPVVAVALGTTATVCHSQGDLPFRSPAVMIVWVLAWSCVSGWLPAINKSLSKRRMNGL